jgi:hypothetical protein
MMDEIEWRVGIVEFLPTLSKFIPQINCCKILKHKKIPDAFLFTSGIF